MTDRRDPGPSAAIVDAQSVKTAEHVGVMCGYDGGKHVKGRKRHVAVDMLGLLLVIVVTEASLSDRAGAKLVGWKLRGRFPRLVTLFAGSGYAGAPLAGWLLQIGTWVLEIVRGRPGTRARVAQQGFAVQPKRRIVERTFGWLNRYRRLSKDYEELPVTSETLIRLAMIHLMLNRLGK